MVLVESRQSVLAAIGMGVVVAALAGGLKPPFGAAVMVVLLLSTQGLALRQAEASRLQASVHADVRQHREEIRSAAFVVFDISSLAHRVSYTWGDRKANVLRAYWGIHTFSGWGFESMVQEVLYGAAPARVPEVRTCSGNLEISKTSVVCDRDYASQEPFVIDRTGALVIDFKAMPLP